MAVANGSAFNERSCALWATHDNEKLAAIATGSVAAANIDK